MHHFLRVTRLIEQADRLRANTEYKKAAHLYLDAINEIERGAREEGVKDDKWQREIMTIARTNIGICFTYLGYFQTAFDNFWSAASHVRDEALYIEVENNIKLLLDTMVGKAHKIYSDHTLEDVRSVQIPEHLKEWYGQIVFISRSFDSSLRIQNSRAFSKALDNMRQHYSELPEISRKMFLLGAQALYIDPNGVLCIPNTTHGFLKNPGAMVSSNNGDQFTILDKEIGLTPKHYYYMFFSDDLEPLTRQIQHGSDECTHIHITDLFIREDRVDVLDHIPPDRLGYFLSFLACGCLFNQVFYTYFPDFYDAFRKQPNFPLITWSVGACNQVNPWSLFDHRIALAHGLQNPGKQEMFEKTVDFMIEYVKSMSKEYKGLKWHQFAQKALEDPDIIKGPNGDDTYGKIFSQKMSISRLNDKE